MSYSNLPKVFLNMFKLVSNKMKVCIVKRTFDCSKHSTKLLCPKSRCDWTGDKCVNKVSVSEEDDHVMNLCIANNVNTLISNFVLMVSILRNMVSVN